MHPQTSLGWSQSGRTLGSLASRTPAVPEKLQMWDMESPADEANATAKTLQDECIALRDFFKALSDLRGKERSLLHGEFVSLYSSPSALAFLHIWDQSECFLIAINWGNVSVLLSYPYAG
ncbi:4F2 cell-surface antigen heavy chain-like isoform X2 [Myxocyprinus asiaticus]|uniref:4F2 cell-surface antigen heavy chain-like isoform X2 n=1 Tax=Myxocyprinus asiaticus TaxID=70543 RepID=UPI0022228D99|nr:4F2 cell-surface antigen heavy chain-like isoform X2 [Myxocyprinus asiaticus]